MRILIYGDSISTGTHGDGAYLKALAEAFNAEIVNRAVSASGTAENTPSSLLSQLEVYDDREADIVLIWHGSNDWYWGTEERNFRAAIEKAVSTIRSRNPFAPLIWFSPLVYRFECPDEGDKAGEATETKNKAGLVITDYLKILEDEARRQGFSYADISSRVQINKYNAEVYLEDGVHPSRKGYDIIQNAIIQSVRNLLSVHGGTEC